MQQKWWSFLMIKLTKFLPVTRLQKIANDNFQCCFLNENTMILMEFSLNFFHIVFIVMTNHHCPESCSIIFILDIFASFNFNWWALILAYSIAMYGHWAIGHWEFTSTLSTLRTSIPDTAYLWFYCIMPSHNSCHAKARLCWQFTWWHK